MSSDVIRISPHKLRYKLDDVSDLQQPVWAGDWDLTRRSPLDECAKHRSVIQRYGEGRRWEDTDLFRTIYPIRFKRGESPRGCTTLDDLARQYYDRMDPLYESLQRHGFVERMSDGVPSKIPLVFLARDGELILGNDGNHRVPMAKLLDLPTILVRIRTRHPDAVDAFQRVTLEPELPDGIDDIPAMTTPSERYAYYRLVRAGAKAGAVVELGTWLGAATAYMAAGIRDEKAPMMYSYDRFDWREVHEQKAGGPIALPMMRQALANLGPLAAHVAVTKAEFVNVAWPGQPISVMVADGPKRLREVRAVLSSFGAHFIKGALIAWQDFAYFPAYDLPAIFHRLEQDGALRFLHGVYPGTTAVFSAAGPIRREALDERRLHLEWSPAEIKRVWARWAERLPRGGVPRFLCGAALFLYDRGAVDDAVDLFRGLLKDHAADIAPKWRTMRERKPVWGRKYAALDAEVAP